MSRRKPWPIAKALAVLLSVLVLPFATVEARPPTGGIVRPQAFKPRPMWVSAVRPDPRAELLAPVNVVRIYSDQHSAEQIAPRRWVLTHLEIANRLYRFRDDEMARYGRGRPAPCIQFRLNKIYDVHEREVSAVLGYPFDTELVSGAGPATNGRRVPGTIDLRTLKVTEGTQFLTVYCVWDIKNPGCLTSSIGGESNVGFADHMPTGRRYTLTKVTSVRARMGVVSAREQIAWMNNFAHELGHYFGLFHAWRRDMNTPRGITGLGTGPKGNVDTDRNYGNVMDYDSGDHVHQYFAKCQLDYMYRFAKGKACTQILIQRQSGGGSAPPPATGTPAARIARVWVDSPSPGGAVVVHSDLEVDHLAGQGGHVVAWFYDGTGQMLRDTDGRYRSSHGQVALGELFQPRFKNARFKDFRLTLPAGQLHLAPGTHRVSVKVGVFAGGRQLATSDLVAFQYVVPGAPKKVVGGGRLAAWIATTRLDPPMIRNGTPWVRASADLIVDNLLGRNVQLQARYYFADGTPLRDFDNRYRSSEGLAFAQSALVPKYPRTRVPNAEVWIPVPQLHLADGAFQIVATLTVVHNGRALASAVTNAITVGKSGTGPKIATMPRSARIDAVWVTHNHTVGGQRGLVVHSRLAVAGCRGQQLTVSAWFAFLNGRALKDFDGRYASADRKVSAFVPVTPLYASTQFADCAIFIPYSQLHLGSGVHDLGVNVGVFQGKTSIGFRKAMTPFRVTWRR